MLGECVRNSCLGLFFLDFDLFLRLACLLANAQPDDSGKRHTMNQKTHHEPKDTPRTSADTQRRAREKLMFECNPPRPAVAQKGAHAVLTATAPDTPPPQLPGNCASP
jgi:hypothetical protein